MGKSNSETTTKFKIDISDLKRSMQEAARQVRLANAEFKEATAGMDKWGESADGLDAKVQQLNKVCAAQKDQLKSLENQYDLTAKVLGENSKEAQELNIKIANQKASIKGTEAQLKKYEQALEEIKSGSNGASTALEKLENTIEKQSEELQEAKRQYESAVLAEGKYSQAAEELERNIKELSGELQQNKTKMSEVEKAADEMDRSIEEATESAEKSEEGFTVMKGALANLMAEGIRYVIDGLKEFSVEAESAYNKFQAQTGASAEEMQKFKEEMNNMYNNAFGETLGDIGDKMAYVKQVTGEVDPSKIRELTENAMTLEETFGSDFNETIRGTENLMTHFGIDASKAFDLYAKGCQEGLDYTGELGDNIAEYGGNFKQAGYSTEEYFQLLKNGAQNGAYNLDKVNDSINEVKNRIGDGTIKENLDMFSDNTKTLFENWENGQGTMKDVIDSIVGDINNCENEQKALTMAATAFGTMGEDANLKVVKSLTTVGENFKDVSGSMQSIKKIRYDDVGTQFKELGRTVAQKLIQPLAKQLLPDAKELTNFLIKNVDKIIPLIKTLGVAITTAFAVNKVKDFATYIKNLSSPVGLATTVISGLAGAVAYLEAQEQKAIEQEYAFTEAQQEVIDATNERTEAYKQMEDARTKETAGIVAEYGYLDQLKTELQGLVDSNGQVKQGYEERANFIVNQLAEALGLEKEKVMELIQGNNDLGESIDQIIEKKKAEALLNANEESYTQAIKDKTAALQAYQENLKTLDEEKEKLEKAAEAKAKYDELVAGGDTDSAAAFYNSNRKLIEGVDEARKSFETTQQAVKDSQKTYVDYCTTIQNYEGLSSAIISGESDKIQEAMQNIQYSFITAETGTKESLENQLANLQQNYEDMKTAIANNTPGVTQEMVDQAKQMVDQAEIELDKLAPKAGVSSVAAGTSYAAGLASQTPAIMLVGQDISNKLLEQLGSPDTQGTGATKIGEYAGGMSSKTKEVAATGRALGNAGASAAGEADYYTVGSNGGQGLINGLASTMNSLRNTATNMATNILKSLKEGLDEHSPSKETYQIGDYAVQGLVNALAAGARKVIAPTKEIVGNMLDTANEGLDNGIEIPNISGVKSSINSAGRSVTGRNTGIGQTETAGTTVINYYQTNNSPVALSRLDIYRQTKNLLGIRGGGKPCLN